MIETCDGCAAPYGYRHNMPLTIDTNLFAVSQNLKRDLKRFDTVKPF